MFCKNTHSAFLGKGFGHKLIGAGKGLAGLLDEPIVQSGVSALSPEIALGYGALKRTGLLEKIKH